MDDMELILLEVKKLSDKLDSTNALLRKMVELQLQETSVDGIRIEENLKNDDKISTSKAVETRMLTANRIDIKGLETRISGQKSFDSKYMNNQFVEMPDENEVKDNKTQDERKKVSKLYEEEQVDIEVSTDKKRMTKRQEDIKDKTREAEQEEQRDYEPPKWVMHALNKSTTSEKEISRVPLPWMTGKRDSKSMKEAQDKAIMNLHTETSKKDQTTSMKPHKLQEEEDYKEEKQNRKEKDESDKTKKSEAARENTYDNKGRKAELTRDKNYEKHQRNYEFEEEIENEIEEEINDIEKPEYSKKSLKKSGHAITQEDNTYHDKQKYKNVKEEEYDETESMSKEAEDMLQEGYSETLQTERYEDTQFENAEDMNEDETEQPEYQKEMDDESEEEQISDEYEKVGQEDNQTEETENMNVYEPDIISDETSYSNGTMEEALDETKVDTFEEFSYQENNIPIQDEEVYEENNVEENFNGTEESEEIEESQETDETQEMDASYTEETQEENDEIDDEVETKDEDNKDRILYREDPLSFSHYLEISDMAGISFDYPQFISDFFEALERNCVVTVYTYSGVVGSSELIDAEYHEDEDSIEMFLGDLKKIYFKVDKNDIKRVGEGRYYLRHQEMTIVFELSK